ncbi:hypothetical protein KSD_79080 [Ktedonobacter sp. SOSP1-85]|nr:hypothetical protein KSD_79080 [Ktedonobacter sp. SOSP1-85]
MLLQASKHARYLGLVDPAAIIDRKNPQTQVYAAPINTERAEASYKDGLLTLLLSKAEDARTRTIKVNVANNGAGILFEQ